MNKAFACLHVAVMVGLVFGGETTDFYRSDENLKRRLLSDFTAEESMVWRERETFKEAHAIGDDQLRRVLMEIYGEARGKLDGAAPGSREEVDGRRELLGVVFWIPLCPDAQTKQFLAGIAAQRDEYRTLRTCALESYLRLADADEAKSVLMRFLVERDRLDAMMRLSVYEYARMAYDEAAPSKRRAIATALSVAAAREEGKIEFMGVDRILSTRSDAYRRSRQRLAMLERHSLEPPTSNLYTDRDLKAALAEARRVRNRTNISTNLDLLRSWNPSQPLPQTNGASVDITVPPPDLLAATPQSESDTKRTKERILYIGGAAALAVAAGSVWLARRRRRASRP